MVARYLVSPPALQHCLTYVISFFRRMFNQQEVQILLGGVNAPIDFDDLRANTQYGGLYDNNEPTIVAFWNVSFFRAPAYEIRLTFDSYPNRLLTPLIKSSAWRY
jgi:hypothetical protein